MRNIDIEAKLCENAATFEKFFERYFMNDDADIKTVADAMRYSAMAGGKRIRPFMVSEFCKLFGGDAELAMPLACALECVHTYSLIHDDLPCMDNDDLRRGKPTCHKVFGEEFALLAGDALLTYAFEIIVDAPKLSPQAKTEAVKLLSSLAGVRGMVGGQTIDLESEGQSIDREKLIKLHSLKTGALMRCAALMGAVAAQAGEEKRKVAEEYAQKVGLAFQIADDILDVTADETELGKTVGSDEQNGKVTFLSFMSVAQAREFAQSMADSAKEKIKDVEGSETLVALTDYIVSRRK